MKHENRRVLAQPQVRWTLLGDLSKAVNPGMLKNVNRGFCGSASREANPKLAFGAVVPALASLA